MHRTRRLASKLCEIQRKYLSLGLRRVARKAMPYKAVIFDIGGVLVPQPQIGIRQYEKDLNVPAGFLGSVFMKGAPNNSFSKLERGELLVSEFLREFDAEVHEAAKQEGVDVNDFKAATLFQMMTPAKSIHKEMFQAIKILRSKNIKTCALTNNWISDGAVDKNSGYMMGFQRFFDVVIQSCIEGIRKPDVEIYKLALKNLQVSSKEAVFLDDIGRNLKPAAELGITCIKVVSHIEALKKLEEILGFNLLPKKMHSVIYPPPVKPDDVPHAVATLKSGIRIHYVEVGEGPVVMLFHGFPDCWYSWRHQIPALASAGYRVIAMDQRGYGGSGAPFDIKEYTQEKLCRDAIDLIDVLGITRAAIVGHDWGGQVVWNLALFYPHRFTGVCGITTPFFTGEGTARLMKNMQVFDYQLYFQAPGVAEKEYEEDLARSFKLMFRGVSDDPLPFPDGKVIKRDTTNVRKRGGILVGFPKEVPIGKLLSEADLEYYVEQYRKNGFRGPLNWYRTREENTQWQSKLEKRNIAIPALMITASHDGVLRPEFSLGMEERVPDLTRVDLKNCSHWAQVEKPDEVNDALIRWLDKIHVRRAKL